MRVHRQLLRLLVLGAFASGCHDPYQPSFPTDMSVGLPTMVWGHTAGMPAGQGRAGMPLAQSNDRVLVGFGGTPTTQPDTWAFSLKNDAWTTLVLGSVPPPGRSGHCVAYLPTQNQIVLVGGHDDANLPQTTPLLFSVGTPGYAEISGDAPTPKTGCAAAYAPGESHVVVFGGATGTNQSAETWLFDGTSQLFAQAQPVHIPDARSGAALIADPGTAEPGSAHLVLFGGLGESGELADVWFWNGSDWGEVGTTADPDTPDTDDPRPVGRADAAVAVDPTRRALYVFGGSQQGTLLNDLWRLDLHTLTWARLHLDNGPPARAQASATYDASLDRMMIFGGRGDSGLLSDGWTLSPAP